MTKQGIILVTEDALSDAVGKKMVTSVCNNLIVDRSIVTAGAGNMKKRIGNFIEASHAIPFLVITDLDNKPCPISLVREWVPRAAPQHFSLRVAVHEIESWLLADKTSIAEFLGIHPKHIPNSPDEVVDPKAALVNAARRARREIREGIVPRRPTISIGPGYNALLGQYVAERWCAHAARKVSKSLNSALTRLTTIDSIT
ncbi:hypothetical protein PTE30175_01999 [Pandoraea terrae]|uniref:DUF4276 family protein n=1 Tax=Pandoraea terrae TaxID=1537710 RepID=A0A5E4UM10_9BURK|nr:DUF4276 family protein [Pandoraea terrae]VVD99894.1 hypothetical protein PTE30175_01999 [Pandoraea terrae]